MASLLSLPAELKLNIIERLDSTSTSFIPTPSRDLLSVSRVCKVLRTLSLPFVLKTITLLNEEKSGTSVLSILHSASAEHVLKVHYIGILAMPMMGELGTEPSADDCPKSVEQALSNLSRLPNVEHVTVQFLCGKTEYEDARIHRDSFEIGYDDLETDEQVLESEKEEGYRSLMEKSYRALSSNPASSIKHLELKNDMAFKCSAWNLANFHALLQGLSSFTISLRGGDNGAGWCINTSSKYLPFISELSVMFFGHLANVKHFSFAATNDGPPGIENGMNNEALPLLGHHMPKLQSLALAHVFISKNLAGFITTHSDTLGSILLDHCYSGWGQEDELCWGDFLSSIASKEMKVLKAFDNGPSDLEQLEPYIENHYKYGFAVRTKDLIAKFPGRRMFDYKHLDDKYGMVFDDEEMAFDKFETGSDESWEHLRRTIKENVGDDR